MEEQNSGKQKPLRPTSNKVKDLYNAYFHSEGRNIPISGPESDEESKSEVQLENNEENTLDTESDVNDEIIETYSKEIGELNNKITSLEKERDELKEQAIRKAAELDNVIKRTTREKLDMIDYANEKLWNKLLPVIDDLGNAIISAKQNNMSENNSIIAGLELILQKTLRLLEEEGLKPIEITPGNPFDVNFHDAMMQMPSEFPEGSIVQEIQKGYMLRNKVLRHSKVITSAGEPETVES